MLSSLIFIISSLHNSLCELLKVVIRSHFSNESLILTVRSFDLDRFPLIVSPLIRLHRNCAAPTSSSSSLCCCCCSSSSPTSKCRRPRAGRSTRSPPASARVLPPEQKSTRRKSSTAWELIHSSE